MIPGYLKNHYARGPYVRKYPKDSKWHGYLGETAIRELADHGENIVDPKPWGAILNPTYPTLNAIRPRPRRA